MSRKDESTSLNYKAKMRVPEKGVLILIIKTEITEVTETH
jgi:hypothetical protein